MGDWLKPGTAEDLLADEVAVHYLRLRELLVRGDENLKCWNLLQTVPYWAADHPALVRAREEQRQMVEHAIDPAAYEAYYQTNVHERPFEQQTGLTVETADRIPRVGWLKDRFAKSRKPRMLIDLSANDGWMLAHFKALGVKGHGFDLNADAVRRANEERKVKVFHDDFRGDGPQHGHAAAVVLFETLEHLPSPAEGLRAAVRYVERGGSLYVSTPLAAVERLDLDSWATVEPKGHLWAITPSAFHDMLSAVGEVEAFEVGPDRVMLAAVKP
jgi:2-polyprenyl-3-methyl-5-hydroxy-6-metoxy-1,4-benzoquinol methylase